MAFKLLTTPDDLGPCQEYCEQLKDEVRRLTKLVNVPRCEDCLTVLEGSEDTDGRPVTICPVCSRDRKIRELTARVRVLNEQYLRFTRPADLPRVAEDARG